MIQADGRSPPLARPRILIADDNAQGVELLEAYLSGLDYNVQTAADGDETLRKVSEWQPDLILLDVMLPELDGLEVCKIIRRDPATSGIPIIMLTAKAAELDRVLGLELGADDYVTKPFSPRELVLRVKNMLKRGLLPEEKVDIIKVGILQIDIPRHLVTVSGRAADLTATEFKLVTLLAQRRGRVQSRDQLLQDVWEYDSVIDTRTVDTHMRRLREKLGDAAKYLDTVRGVGYRLIEIE